MAEPKCPECGRPVETRFAPFCSARCQQIDLGRWLKGDYVIPAKPEEEDGTAAGGPVSEAEEED